MKILIHVYLYVIYPIFTIWFASQASLIRDNLSIIGNLEGMYPIFIIWGICCEIALGIGFHQCIHKSIYRRILIPLLAICSAMYLTSIFLPYLPEQHPILSELHITLSFVGLICMLAIVALMVISLKMTYSIYPYDMLLLLIFGSAIGIFGANYMSVNSLVEIFLGIIIPIYLYQLGGKLK